jgi:hypothetical protein
MIENPVAMSSTPPPMAQRRSKPVNGSVEAFSFELLVVLVGVSVVLVLGDASLLGVVFSSFEGEVPVVGVVFGVVDGVVDGVVAGGFGAVWL